MIKSILLVQISCTCSSQLSCPIVGQATLGSQTHHVSGVTLGLLIRVSAAVNRQAGNRLCVPLAVAQHHSALWCRIYLLLEAMCAYSVQAVGFCLFHRLLAHAVVDWFARQVILITILLANDMVTR